MKVLNHNHSYLQVKDTLSGFQINTRNTHEKVKRDRERNTSVKGLFWVSESYAVLSVECYVYMNVLCPHEILYDFV